MGREGTRGGRGNKEENKELKKGGGVKKRGWLAVFE